MDAKVIKPFFDLANPEDVYAVGDKFTGTAERVKGLQEKGFVVVEEKPRRRTAKSKE